MKICPKCGVSNETDAKFCVNCGASLKDAVKPQKKGKKTNFNFSYCSDCLIRGSCICAWNESKTQTNFLLLTNVQFKYQKLEQAKSIHTLIRAER